jgi:hypothetical protein
MFSATNEEPPREYAMTWSKCRLSELPLSAGGRMMWRVTMASAVVQRLPFSRLARGQTLPIGGGALRRQ